MITGAAFVTENHSIPERSAERNGCTTSVLSRAQKFALEYVTILVQPKEFLHNE